jgi:hypothetical protein
MAKNLELREKSSDTFAGDDKLIYMRTHIDQVDGLLSNSKLDLAIIPSAILETKKLAGVITADITLGVAYNTILAYHDDETVLIPGSYLISQGQHTITDFPGHFIQYSDDGLAAGNQVTLENGDHLYYIKGSVGYLWNEVTLDLLGVADNEHIFASDEELASNVPTTADVSAIVTGYKWEPTTEADYNSAANHLDVTGTDIPTDRWSANAKQPPISSYWDSNDGDVVMKYTNGVVIYYFRLEEVIPGGYPDTAYGSGTIKMYRSQVNSETHLWGVINNSYNLATQEAQGLMSPAMVTKLLGIAPEANKYIHPTHPAVDLDAATNETINQVRVDPSGHVIGFTKQSIVEASVSAKGLIEIANTAEMTTVFESGTLDALRAATPATVKAAIDYFAGMKIYNDISTDLGDANAAHPNGALALFAS